jgi:hypothetical protein
VKGYERKFAKNKWMIDAGLFGGFLLAFFLDLTGIELHQWLGIAAGAIAAYHLVTHWSWVTAVTRRFFSHTSNQSRLYYLVDAGMMAGFFAMVSTGVVISTWLSLSFINYETWKAVHIASAALTLLLTVLKIGLHGRWIVSTARKIFSPAQPAVALAAQRISTLPAARAPQGFSRREFLKTMSVVSVASFAAMTQAVKGLAASGAGGSSSATTATSSANSTATTTNTSSSTSSACTVRCPKGCAFPGRCRRYQDSSGSHRCDLGECL